MNDINKQHIDSLRHQRARARRNIAAAAWQIADAIDRARLVEVQQMALKGIDIELNRLGYRPPPVIRLDTPPPRQPARSPVVRHLDTKLTIRSIDSQQRVIDGIATTPAPDHLHDVVEPMGARFELPLPLLLGHDHQSPVGEVFAAKPSSTGIAITAKIAQVDTPGAVKDLVDRAWDLVRHGLIKCLSIGFKPLKAEPLEGGRGMRFLEYRWLELSLVVVPAQPQARITGTRSWSN